MVINAMKMLLLLALSVSVPVTVCGQTGQADSESQFKSTTYDVSWVIPSDDMKYITFQKTYDYSADTLALVSTERPGRILFQEPGIHPNTVRFTGKGFLFLSGPKNAVLLRLKTLKQVRWENIVSAFYMERYDQIGLIKDKKFEIFTEEGEPVEVIQNVVSAVQKAGRFFYIQDDNGSFNLIEWTPQSHKIVYRSSVKDINIVYNEGSDLVVVDRITGKAHTEIKYMNSDEEIPLHADGIFPLKSVGAVSRLSANRFFLALAVKNKVVQKQNDVDVWYAHDNDLFKKFYNDAVMKYVIWNPLKREVLQLDHLRFPVHINTGQGRFLLAFDPKLFQDYTKEMVPRHVYRYDIETRTYDLLGITGRYMYTDKKGRYLLSHNYIHWMLFDIENHTARKIEADKESVPYFSLTGDKIIFPGKGKIGEYDIVTGATTTTLLPSGFNAEISGGIRESVPLQNSFYVNYYDPQKAIPVRIWNPTTVDSALGLYWKGRLQLLNKISSDHHTFVAVGKDDRTFLYIKRNYNLPPQLVISKRRKEETVYKTNPEDRAVLGYKMQKILYTNSQGVSLTGLLYSPSNLSKTGKYPMVVGIYEQMHHTGNRYLHDGFNGNIEGINIRHYLDRGYFIYLPDIVYDGRGPGRSAVDCVESAIHALQHKKNIDFERIGLVGHSHGGYETNFIATQSNLFAAYVGGAGNSDLVRSYHSFNYNYTRPFYWQFEEQQYRMFKSFAEDKNLYIDNSPVYHAEKVSKPILLWTGTNDQNIYWEQTMEYYLALRRNNKKVIALFYDKEDHSFIRTVNRHDLFIRISEWFDYHLKGVKKDWIDLMNQ